MSDRRSKMSDRFFAMSPPPAHVEAREDEATGAFETLSIIFLR